VAKTGGGNQTKYKAYRFAWERIEQAQKAGFHLEAVTIEESIISDRLQSYLKRPGAVGLDKSGKSKKKDLGLYDLLEALRIEHPNGVSIRSHQGPDRLLAIDEIHGWRRQRNDLIHKIVKSQPGQPPIDVEAFNALAKAAAARGERIARDVLGWAHAEKRKSKEPKREDVR